MKIFIDDFSVYGSSFENCLKNLETILQRCQDKNLVLNWEKCHFMVTKGVVLGHKIFVAGLEVDQAKVFVIEIFMPLTKMKGIKVFWDMLDFIKGL